MRNYGSLKGLPMAVLLLSLAVTAVVAICRTGRAGNQYWDELGETCRNCSTCTLPGHIVLRPCQVYQDTVCGPLHALNIDWSWLGHRPRNGTHHGHHKKHGHWLTTTSITNSSFMKHRYYKHWHRMNGNKSHHHHHHHHYHYNQFHLHKKLRPPESAAQLKTQDGDAKAAFSLSAEGSPLSSMAHTASASLKQTQPPVFTTTEALVWDWQAVVLTLAVFACVLFFGAAAGYGVRQVRHDACRTEDVEDLSAALGLMIPAVDSGGSVVDTCNTKQCLYMEKLLVSKQLDGRGNVYIDRDNNGCPRM